MINEFNSKYNAKKLTLGEKTRLIRSIGLKSYYSIAKINQSAVVYLFDKNEYIKNGMGIDNFITLSKHFELYNIDKFNSKYKNGSDIHEQMSNFLDNCIETGEAVSLAKLPPVLINKYGNLFSNNIIKEAIENGRKLSVDECNKISAPILVSIPKFYLLPEISEFISNNYNEKENLNYFEYKLKAIYNILQNNPLHYNVVFELSKTNLSDELLEKIVFDEITTNFQTNIGIDKKEFMHSISLISSRDVYLIMLYRRNLSVDEYLEIISCFSKYPGILNWLDVSDNNDYGAFVNKYGKDDNYFNDLVFLKDAVNNDFLNQAICGYKFNPSLHDDDMINYLWKCINAYRQIKTENNVLIDQKTIKEKLLLARKINVSPNLIETSSLYQGVPFDYIEKVRKMGIENFIFGVVLDHNKDVSLNFSLIHKNEGTIYKAVQIFTEHELSLIFRSKNVNSIHSELRPFYNANTFCSDTNNGIDLLDQLLSINLDSMDDIVAFKKLISDKYDFDYKYIDFIQHNSSRRRLQNRDAYNQYYDEYVADAKKVMVNKLGIDVNMLINFDLLNLSDLAYQNLYALETTKKWIEYYSLRNSKENKEVKLDFNFVTRIPLTMVDRAYESQLDYNNFFSNMCKRYNVETNDLNTFSKSILGLAISFDYFNAEKRDEIENRMSLILDKRFSHEKSDDSFEYIFSSATYYTNKDFLEDLRNNYEFITKDIIVLAEYLVREKNNVSSVKELVNNCNRVYRNICVNAYESARDMFLNGIDEDTFRILHSYYTQSLEREGSSIPYIKGETDGLEFEALRLWDSYLMSFDSQNKFANCNLEIKKDIMTNNNIRVIVVKDKNGKIIEHILVTREKGKLFFEFLDAKYDNAKTENLLNDIFTHIKSTALENNDEISSYACEKPDRNNGIDKDKMYVDPVKKYTVNTFNNNIPEFLRISKVYNQAFSLAATQSGEFSREIHNHTKTTQIAIGRDWYISWEKKLYNETNEEAIVIHQLARYNENKNSYYGRKELQKTLSDIINNETCMIRVSAQRPSYYLFAKMAANGDIMVTEDDFIVVSGEGMISYENVLNSFRVNGIINNDFANGKLNNYDNYPTHSRDSVRGNKLRFYSTKARTLTINEQKELDEQKNIYGKVIENLEKHRDEEKRRGIWYYQELTDEEKEKAKTLLGIDNFADYSPNYIRYKIKQHTLSDFDRSDLPEIIGERSY